MTVEVPESLKASVPPTRFGKILAVTPVILAVVATLLAGLASSEMTAAQYDRALAAQQQSKAGDQWSFFQAKRLRSSYQSNTADLLISLTETRPLDVSALRNAAAGDDGIVALLNDPLAARALILLQHGEGPPLPPASPLDPKVKAALDGLEHLDTDAELAALLAPVSTGDLETALHGARDQAEAFDAATNPINAFIEQLRNNFDRIAATQPVNSGPSLPRDVIAARLRYTAARYEAEARLNQAIANLYELQVRKSNISAERHHARSEKFFYGMLAAQLGVIVSTLALAAKKRNLLWTLAAAVGLTAVIFAAYVYLRV